MPTPYDLYVRFLVTKGEDDVTVVNERLAELNLPEIDESTFSAQYDLVHEALPGGVLSQITNKTYSIDFLKWMEVLQVVDLWAFEKTPFTGKDPVRRGLCKLTYDIHQDPKLRLSINALLMKAVKLGDIIQAVNTRYAALLSEAHLALYQRFFFDPRLMTRRAWKDYLRVAPPAEAAIYFTALSAPIEQVRTELELPAKLSTAETLQYLTSRTYVKAKDALAIRTPEGGDEARKWIHTYLQLIDKFEKFRTGDTDDFAQALQMEFEFVDGEFLTPDPDVLNEITARMRKDPEAKPESEPKP